MQTYRTYKHVFTFTSINVAHDQSYFPLHVQCTYTLNSSSAQWLSRVVLVLWKHQLPLHCASVSICVRTSKALISDVSWSPFSSVNLRCFCNRSHVSSARTRDIVQIIVYVPLEYGCIIASHNQYKKPRLLLRDNTSQAAKAKLFSNMKRNRTIKKIYETIRIRLKRRRTFHIVQ